MESQVHTGGGSATTSAGASQPAAPEPAKRPREPSPPAPRAGAAEAGFDFSALSSDEEEEE